jgi:dTDP-4-amino-4,6-dideoxygalactose transaminase
LAYRTEAPLLSATGAKALNQRVPYFDLVRQYDQIRDEVLAAIDRACTSAQFVLGDEVARFEEEFANYCGVRHCVALNTGTSALHLALLAGGVQPGDEVVTSPNTFIATAEAISYTGARPVFADIRAETGNIDPAAVESVITERTGAIIPIHLYGRPADLDTILDIAARHSVPVIEDASQAHGASHRGKRVGGFGLAAAFSFYPAKNLGAYGEGGALTTNDDAVAELARMLRDHGSKKRYHHDAVGFNYRMDGFQGAILRIKLRRLEEWTMRRQELAALYRDLLAGTNVDLPEDDPDNECVNYVFVVYVDNRDSVQAALENRGIGTGIHFPIPLHLQKAYADLGYERGDFPLAEDACDRTLSLPIFPELTPAQVQHVAAALTDVVGTS